MQDNNTQLPENELRQQQIERQNQEINGAVNTLITLNFTLPPADMYPSNRQVDPLTEVDFEDFDFEDLMNMPVPQFQRSSGFNTFHSTDIDMPLPFINIGPRHLSDLAMDTAPSADEKEFD